jgi:hypothetical protein
MIVRGLMKFEGPGMISFVSLSFQPDLGSVLM